MVEQAAVNGKVQGSSPWSGATIRCNEAAAGPLDRRGPFLIEDLAAFANCCLSASISSRLSRDQPTEHYIEASEFDDWGIRRLKSMMSI